MKRYGKRIDKIRTEIKQSIYEMMYKHGYKYAIPIYMTDSPVIQVCVYDANHHFTLDCVGARDGELYFGGSSCGNGITLFTWQMPVERLIDIYEWLVDNEDEVFGE